MHLLYRELKMSFKIYARQDKFICRRLFDNAKMKLQDFGDNSSLHGVGHVLSLKPIPIFKRLFWFTVLSSCCMGAAQILKKSLGLYSADVISYSVDTNNLAWETTFPAITICEQFDADRLKASLVRNKLPSSLNLFFKEVSYWNVMYCNRVCNRCKFNTTCVKDFPLYTKLMRLNCSQLLTDCWWNGEYFPCCERFHPLQTEYGTCYSFNSQLASNQSVVKINRRTGLINLLLTSPQPILVRVHAPDDGVSVSMEDILGRTNSFLHLATDFKAYFKVEETISDETVRSLSRKMRGCLYRYEKPAFAHNWPYTIYSYNTCLLYCRAVEQMAKCNCTHHLMPGLKEVQSCDIQGMLCLNENRDALSSVDCKCPMSCEEIEYKVMHIFSELHRDKISVKRGTRAQFGLSELPSLRVRRHAIRGMLGLVVDIGGVGGVFFGASLLSVIEIFYLLFIRKFTA